jgi:hypothetical protein
MAGFLYHYGFNFDTKGVAQLCVSLAYLDAFCAALDELTLKTRIVT